MVTNMKFYVLTVISIFLALGIGIFIGFMFDAQDVLLSQKEDIVDKIEEKFDYLKTENEEMKKQVDKVSNENEDLNAYIENYYPELIKGRLDGLKISVIETNDDYMYSSVINALELAGGDVTSITTIKDNFINDEDALIDIYTEVTGEELKEDITPEVIDLLIRAITSGEETEIIALLNNAGIIDVFGEYVEEVDYIVLAGGSMKEEENRLDIIDKKVVDYSKQHNIPIVGVEKVDVNKSYTNIYKDYGISSVDNIDTVIGRTSLIMIMEGNPGNYGVKDGADELTPQVTTYIFNQ